MYLPPACEDWMYMNPSTSNMPTVSGPISIDICMFGGLRV